MAVPPRGLKIFLPAKDDLQISSEYKETKTKHGNSKGDIFPLDGSQVKNFYEELVGLHDHCKEDGSTGAVSSHNQPEENITPKKTKDLGSRKRRRKRRHKSDSQHRFSQGGQSPQDSQRQLRNQNSFLKAAQNGDVKQVKDLLSDGVNINCQDGFGWSALMCASHSGHMTIVQILLEAGADLDLEDTIGRTAEDISQLAKQRKISQVLDRHRTGNDPFGDTEPVKPVNETFYCNVCKKKVTDVSVKKHETSTIHLFNCRKKPKPTTYFIPESNKGYQLLLRSGWNQEGGLGPEGQGKKFPVATVLKRDRKGIGEPVTKKAKVTHFGPGETKAVSNREHGQKRRERNATVGKRKQAKKLTKEKAKEKQFRLEFY